MKRVIILVAPPEGPELDPSLADAVRAAVSDAGYVIGPAHWLAPGRAVELPLDQGPDDAPLEAIHAALDEAPIDAAVLPAQGRRKKLLVADMDSTIITVECIDELADFAGIKAEIAAVTERAMRGELRFEEALVERVAKLKGLPVSVLQRAYDERVRLMPGARSLVQTMRRHAVETVLVSGGFTFFADRVAKAAGFHQFHANMLEVEDGRLTGTVKHPILGADAKLNALKGKTAKWRLDLSETMAIGDGANDIPMMQTSGLGVAYHPKPKTAAAADAVIRHGDLTTALYFQGYGQDEIVD